MKQKNGALYVMRKHHEQELNLLCFLIFIMNLPYLFIAMMATKLGQAWRLAEGTLFSEKFLHLVDGFRLALETTMPSFHPFDLFVGFSFGIGIRFAVYVHGKNTKKYRKNMEYGSARWRTSNDIRPYVLIRRTHLLKK